MFDWDENCLTFKATFTPSVEADGCYVSERTSLDGGFTRFGPMPADWVEPFIAERKQYWSTMAAEQVRRFNALSERSSPSPA